MKTAIFFFTLLLGFLSPAFVLAQPVLPINPPQNEEEETPPSSENSLVFKGNGLHGSYLISYLKDYYYYTNTSGKNYDNSRQYL
ncbi:hypothetical protein, partial [Nodularia spumigena]|uniref:hypothetical protein n=1 Tax=Nodularia spumigena TaxID=70799 RepID=UPI002B20A00A